VNNRGQRRINLRERDECDRETEGIKGERERERRSRQVSTD
jgi:hypothetical protein